jgi:hypothetical protein
MIITKTKNELTTVRSNEKIFHQKKIQKNEKEEQRQSRII